MHCKLRQPDSVQSLYALISSPMPSLNSLSLSVAVLSRFYYWHVTLRYAVTLNFDPVTLTFDLWPWTYVVCQLCYSQTLKEMRAKSDNPRRSYCSLNTWPYDLEHLSRVTLCSRIVCTKFKLSQAIRSWNATIFWCHQVVTRGDLDL